MSWDYIIVGAGSAGCALAGELIKSGRTVLIVEAGGADRSPFIKVAAGHSRACANHDWGYTSQPDPSRNGATDHWTRGRVLGGSSSINGTMYVRGTPADFDRWGVDEWSAQDVMPIFSELEGSDQPGASRGRHGPLSVRTVRRPHAITRAFVEAAQATGQRFNEDYNDGEQAGVGYAQLSQRRGLRCSAADAFLKPLLRRPKARLLLHALVEKVEVARGRAVAVWVRERGTTRREQGVNVVVCAGAINSPQLLMLSGIGDARGLESHGIRVTVDLPGVGRNLKEQPLIALTYRSRIATHNPTEGLLQKLAIAAEFAVRGEGPLANLFEAAAFLRSRTSEPVPDIQLLFLPFGFVRSPEGRLRLAPYRALLVMLIKSYPDSTGCIRLASARADDPPLIECRLLEATADVDTLVRGIGAVRTIMNTEPIAALISEEMTPGASIDDRAGLERFTRENTTLSFHPIGTCRMGAGRDAVVGPDLRVRGIENLWVADASIMPDQISGNTNAACMMIGMKLGKQLAAGGN